MYRMWWRWHTVQLWGSTESIPRVWKVGHMSPRWHLHRRSCLIGCRNDICRWLIVSPFHEIYVSNSRRLYVVEMFEFEDENKNECPHGDWKCTKEGAFLQESAARLTDLLLLAPIQLHSYYFDIIKLSRIINALSHWIDITNLILDARTRNKCIFVHRHCSYSIRNPLNRTVYIR